MKILQFFFAPSSLPGPLILHKLSHALPSKSMYVPQRILTPERLSPSHVIARHRPGNQRGKLLTSCLLIKIIARVLEQLTKKSDLNAYMLITRSSRVMTVGGNAG